MPIGQGFDIHRLAAGRPCILGGVTLPFEKGPLGHSDGDPLLHALCDAILGAAGQGDIGERFPDTDPRWHGTASAVFVTEAVRLAAAAGWSVENADLTVLAERPKLAPHKAAIRGTVARLLGIPEGRVNVKAKTLEGLGPIGAGEAIAALAVVSLAPARSPDPASPH